MSDCKVGQLVVYQIRPVENDYYILETNLGGNNE